MDARRVTLVGLAAVVAIVEGAAGAAGAAALATPVRATLGAPSQPRADGVFIASLSGRTLQWRLTFNGLAGPASAAHLHLGKSGDGPVAIRLCVPCVSGVAGTALLAPVIAAAVLGRRAYVDVHTASGSIRGQTALGTVPTLQLAGIVDGATLRLPAPVRYVVTGFSVGAEAGRITASTGLGTEIRLQPGPAPGVVYLPDDKMLTGRRDLTFALTRADGTQPANREARVTVYGVLLTGRR